MRGMIFGLCLCVISGHANAGEGLYASLEAPAEAKLTSADLSEMIAAMEKLASRISFEQDREAAMARIGSGIYDEAITEFALALDHEVQQKEKAEKAALVAAAASKLAANKGCATCGPNCQCVNGECGDAACPTARASNRSVVYRVGATDYDGAVIVSVGNGGSAGSTGTTTYRRTVQYGTAPRTVYRRPVVRRYGSSGTCRIVNGRMVCR